MRGSPASENHLEGFGGASPRAPLTISAAEGSRKRSFSGGSRRVPGYPPKAPQTVSQNCRLDCALS